MPSSVISHSKVRLHLMSSYVYHRRMKTKHVIKHYGTKAAVAAALGVSRQAVSQWAEIVPYESATILARIAGLPLVDLDYPRLRGTQR